MWIFLLIVVVAVLAVLFLPQLKGWRTQFFGSASLLVGGILPLAGEISGFLKDLDWREYVPSDYAPFVFMGMTVVFMVLRYVTTGPVGSAK